MKPNYYGNQVEVCTKDVCVRAQGKQADRIAGAAVLMLVLIGIGALISAAR